MSDPLAPITCEVCNRVIYTKDGPVCVDCRTDDEQPADADEDEDADED